MNPNRLPERPLPKLPMKNTYPAALAAMATLLCMVVVSAAPFDSGSTGAYGPINVTSNTTLEMPADGIFHCTTIHVPAGLSLRFAPNPLNTPVYLLATGAVTIVGTLDVSGAINSGGAPGRGGPGGFDGGYGGFGLGDTSKGGDGQGPGGGRNLARWYGAAYTAAAGFNTNKYGNSLCIPLIGGSGGSGGDGNPGPGGGGGGGAILVAANVSITVGGRILANSANGFGGGSGGTVRLVSPLVTGIGSIQANPGGGYSGEVSSPGRIRVDCEDRQAFRTLNLQGFSTRGAQLFAFPSAPLPRLDIVEAAGQSIPFGTGSSVQIELPAGSATTRTVRVQARHFIGTVPITVVVIPENSPSTRYDAQIDMASGNPAEVTVEVLIPRSSISRIQTWTR